jgi:hypothetical protein
MRDEVGRPALRASDRTERTGPTGMSREDRGEVLERLSRQFEGALSGLEMGTLPLNKELLDHLKGLDLENLRRLSPEEIEALRKRLAQGAKVCKLGLGEGEGDGSEDALLLMSMAGQGTGGVDRGPGVAPMWLNPEKTDLHSSRLEPVSNNSMGGRLGGWWRRRRAPRRYGAYRGPVALRRFGSGPAGKPGKTPRCPPIRTFFGAIWLGPATDDRPCQPAGGRARGRPIERLRHPESAFSQQRCDHASSSVCRRAATS